MKIEVEDKKAYVFTPFNQSFVTAMRSMGGSWDKSRGAWVIDSDFIEAAREKMRQIYGADDRPVKTVTVKITAIKEITQRCGGISIFGRPVAHAFGRDSGAKVDDGIAFIKGSPISDGSVKNWHTTIPEGSVFIIKGVPEDAVKNLIEFNGETMNFDVLHEDRKGKDELLQEKENLLKRIREIDFALSHMEEK